MLGDFFRINLPYGMRKNENDEWSFFNREYVPLGWNSTSREFGKEPFSELPIHTKYSKLTEATLLKVAWSEDGIRRNENGKINMIWFYNDETNPMNDSSFWDQYFERIKLLSKCKVNREMAY